MLQKEKNIEFLNKLSNILTKKISPSNTIGEINKLFKQYLNIAKAEIVIWDNNTMSLKDFVEDWKLSDNDIIEKGINTIYGSLAITEGTKFFFNESEFDCDLNEEEQYRILELKSDRVERADRLTTTYAADSLSEHIRY